MVYMFRQLDVYGVSVPSTVAVAAVTEGVNDESLKVIAQASNNWVNNQNMIINPCILASGTLYYELSKLFERRCKILESIEASLNLSSKYYIKSTMVLSWHVSVRSSNFPWDSQKYGRIAARKSKGKDNISYPELNFTTLLQPGDSNLQRGLVDELIEAMNYVNNFHTALNLIDIRLTAQFGETEKEWFDITKKHKQDLNQIYPYECPFCGIRKWVDRGVRVPSSCGCGECKLKYGASIKSENRKANHTDQSVGVRKHCIDCGKKRVVYKNTRCKKCSDDLVR
jgi:hypothetical protein